MKSKTSIKLEDAINYKRTVIADSSTVYQLTSFDDVALGRRRFAIYTPEGKRVPEDKERELLLAKGVENPLLASRDS